LKVFKEKALDEVDGGRSLAYPQIDRKNETFKSYRGSDEIAIAQSEGLTHAEYDWSQYAGSLVLEGIEEFKNSSAKERIVSLLESKILQLEESAVDKLTDDIFAATTTGTNMNSLRQLIATSNNTVGGINSSTFDYWRNVQSSSVTTFGTSTNAAGLTEMNRVMKLCTKAVDSPDVIMTTLTIHGWIETALAASQRFLTDTASYGFSAMPFKGAKIYFDGKAPDNEIRFINTKDLRLAVGKGRNFKLSEKVAPANQDIKVWTYLVYLQLVAKSRRTHVLCLEWRTKAN
jgi:hypothetical protein